MDHGFSEEIAKDAKLSTADVAVHVAWFIGSTSGSTDGVPLSEVFSFIEKNSIRGTLNRSRLVTELLKRRDISVADRKNVRVHLKRQMELKSKYSKFLLEPPFEPEDNILQLEDWATSREYVHAIARQVNATFQIEAYDACAVMMRRLVEVLIIDAYDAANLRARIITNGNFHMLNGLIGSLTSGSDFKLSRNAPKWLDRLKELGDNAAHSRTYITKKLDIDEFKGAYRNLATELKSLTKG